jgi:hypothetical protein
MNTFLAVFTGTPDSPQRAAWNKLDEATRNARQSAGMKAWGDWMKKYERAVVAGPGGPLGKTKRISPKGVADTSNNLAAFVIVQAESHEAAARMFENHPHFTIFPGEAVEVMPVMPIPGQ